MTQIPAATPVSTVPTHSPRKTEVSEMNSVTPPSLTLAPGASSVAGEPARGQVLRVDGVSVVYESDRGRTAAVDSVSMAMRAGEFVSILGPSGCGKSTLLNVVAGLLRATSGKVSVFDQPIDGTPHRDIGIVFQQARLLPWLNVRENIFIPIDTMRLKRTDYVDRAQALLHLVGLEKFAKHYPDELSGGMQQRVALARSMIHNPKLLLMDEPFAALDAMTRERMSVELQDILAKSGQSVLFITHSIPEAVFLSDRILMMSTSPGRFIEEVSVGLKRPRVLDTMASAEFAELCGRLRKLYTH